jgi:glycosyltransferase involved in cell wall biosynthesis
MKTAIVHDYLNQAGGAERVVAHLHQMFPQAPIYTTIVNPESLWPALRDADIRHSWMQRLPFLEPHFKKYLPFYPLAIESLRLEEYDLVISSSSAFAKGAITRSDAIHVCYCHTPMRFVFDYDRYVEREQYGKLVRTMLPWLLRPVRRWDLRTASRPDVYIANSTIVAKRIEQYYGYSAEIIPPPVDLERYAPADEVDDYFLVVSRLVPYKRVDLVVQAFNMLQRRLVVIGDGPDRSTLEDMAGPNVEFLGRIADSEIARYFARCRALILPGEEDFGITPLEANASGRPVIAYGAGGALDTVLEDHTGVLFREQTPASLAAAVRKCESTNWDAENLRGHAERYGPEVFQSRIRDLLQRTLAAR